MIKINSDSINYLKKRTNCLRSAILGILGILGNLGISFRLDILIYFRHFRHFSSKHFSQRGLAYVAILVLLAVVSTLAMAFLFKTGTLRSTTVNRLAGMQADYLAETAANHALWRLLNDPGFPASETDYYMHNLGAGRYGYNVHRPTHNTFAAVATVGVVGSVVARQSYVQYIKPENIYTVYDRLNEAIPKFRRLVGASWSLPADTVNDGPDRAIWTVLKGYPKTDRRELIMGTLDNLGHINFSVYNGAIWNTATEFTQTAGPTTNRPFDIAYENLSGRALAVGRTDGTTTVRYSIWNGTAWSAVQNAFSNASGTMTYLTMASKPGSDEILIATVTSDNDLKVFQWDGVTFTEQGGGLVEGSLTFSGYGSVDIAYEQQSGNALVMWSRAGDARILYAVWDGISLSSASFGRNLNDNFSTIRAAADPASNYIFLTAVNYKSNLYAAVWDGMGWINSRTLDAAVVGTAGPIMDVAWELAGQDALVAWTSSSSSNNVSYLAWQKGSSLPSAVVKLGPALGAAGGPLRLVPLYGRQKILLLAKTGAPNLRYSWWTGSSLKGNPAYLLENSVFSGVLNFDAAETGSPYTGGSG